jgi:LDH2 family malate/lactate/ureidoglycolate dehydrogenase
MIGSQDIFLSAEHKLEEDFPMVEEVTANPKVMARHDQLETFCTQVLQKLGVPREEAEITANTLVTANLRGVDTHGVLRLPLYAARLKGGAMSPSVNLTTEKETVATALLNGHDGIGQVISYRAMEIAIRKAREAGVSYVAVSHSNHFGAAAYYPMMALDHDMIGLAFTNASPRLAPTGGVEKLLGNNPWCVAVPAGKRPPVVLDMANSIVAAGKIRILQKEGRPVPEGWALNEHGEPTTDPTAALKGILLAIGGYKGYGITLMVDLLTGVLTDSNFGPRVKSLDQDVDPAGTSHSFMAIALSAFTDVAAFKARMDAYIDEIKSSKKAKGTEVIYVPGEPEHIRVQERKGKGILLQAKVAAELRALGKDLGIPIDL